MSWKAVTEVVLVAVSAALIGWDIFVIVKAGTPSSISEVLFTSAKAHPIIAFALGVLMGHLFWSQ